MYSHFAVRCYISLQQSTIMRYHTNCCILAMCNELDRMAFCIWRIIDSHLSSTSSLIFFSASFEHSPKGIHDDVILIDLILRISARQL